MKKFLAVFDGFRMSDSTLSYAVELSALSGAQLVGVFLDDAVYHSYPVVSILKSKGNADALIKKLDEKDQKKRDASVAKFQKACTKAGVSYSVHRDQNIAINEIKHESMFADLVIVNEYETFTRFKEEAPTRFIRELLGDVQCPVVVVPNQHLLIDKIVLLYDGKPSSLFAIRQFSYLFGGQLTSTVEVFTVKDNYMPSLRIPDAKLMKEFIGRHFPKATFKVVKGVPEEEILQHLKTHRENELVVLGAYRRSEISRWFRNSLADVLMKKLDTPLFIAHS